MKKIGVLALQGAFAEHISSLEKLGFDPFEIRKKSDIVKREIDGLIIPGGESTVIGKLLNELDIMNPLKHMIDQGLPVMGTCAGLILLAKEIGNDHKEYFGAINIRAKRNAYGRQLGSFKAEAHFKGIGNIPMVFIRAPFIESVGRDVEVLAEVDNKIVAAKEGNVLVTAFHPELTEDLSIHKYFIKNMCR